MVKNKLQSDILFCSGLPLLFQVQLLHSDVSPTGFNGDTIRGKGTMSDRNRRQLPAFRMQGQHMGMRHDVRDTRGQTVP